SPRRLILPISAPASRWQGNRATPVAFPSSAKTNGELRMAQDTRPLALVTGASTGIGYELAKCCAENGFDLVVVADEPEINKAASDFRALGARVEAVEADLATLDGVDRFLGVAKKLNRPVEALLAN